MKMRLFGCICLVQTAIWLHTPGRVPYPADRVTVWGEAHGPARIRSKLAAVYSSDRLDSGERLPLRISHWEGGNRSTFGDFHAYRRSTPSDCPVRYFYVLKQKYRTLHPGGKFSGQRLVLLKLIYLTLKFFFWMPWHLIYGQLNFRIYFLLS